MQKSLASSYIIEISPRGKQAEKINLQTSFPQENPSGNSSSRDIIDVLEANLQIADTFNLNNERFGANTAADSGYEQTLSEESVGYVTSNTHASIRLDHIASSGDIYSEDKQVHLGKYIHFVVEYGETGDNSIVHRAGVQESFQILPDDQVCRHFNVFIAFSDDIQSKNGVVIIESRGRHSIISPMVRVLKRATKKISGCSYTSTITPFAEAEAVKRLIDRGRVKKVRLISNARPDTPNSPMNYTGRELVYYQPTGTSITRYLKEILTAGFKNTPCDIDDITNFMPDEIKFEVAGEGGRSRTYTAGDNRAALAQIDLGDIVDPDGVTNEDKFCEQAKQIFVSQHINL